MIDDQAEAALAARPAAKPLTVVGATRGWRAVDLVEILRHRDLLKFLIWRDLKVRYQQTLLGGLWAILQPLATTGLFTLVFGKLAKLPSDGVPYPLFSFVGVMVWSVFSQGLNGAVGSLVGSTQLVEKVYFPRLILPLATVLKGLADFGIAFVFLLFLMFFYGAHLHWTALWVAPLILIALVAALGVGAGLGALNVRYRDVRQTMPLLTQVWLFLTPVAYPASLAPQAWRPLLGLNPMAGVVEGCRWALLGNIPPPIDLIAISTCSALVMLAAGLAVFRRMEGSFADII